MGSLKDFWPSHCVVYIYLYEALVDALSSVALLSAISSLSACITSEVACPPRARRDRTAMGNQGRLQLDLSVGEQPRLTVWRLNRPFGFLLSGPSMLLHDWVARDVNRSSSREVLKGIPRRFLLTGFLATPVLTFSPRILRASALKPRSLFSTAL